MLLVSTSSLGCVQNASPDGCPLAKQTLVHSTNDGLRSGSHMVFSLSRSTSMHSDRLRNCLVCVGVGCEVNLLLVIVLPHSYLIQVG